MKPQLGHYASVPEFIYGITREIWEDRGIAVLHHHYSDDIVVRSPASVVVGNKTYDGTTSAVGTVTLNGIVGGDTVGTSGTTFTFSDKNAGTGKTVNVSGTALTGTDAGNYALTVPASALADILQKAINKSRPGYAGYVKRTSAFVPWPPSRHPRA